MQQLHLRPSDRADDDRARAVRRRLPSTVVSALLHVVLGMVVWNAFQMPRTFDDFFSGRRAPETPRERVQYVAVEPAGPQARPSAPPARRPPAAPQSRGPVSPAEPAPPPLVAPAETPTELPPPSSGPPTSDRPPFPGPKTGPLAGGTGPTRGAQPTFEDPRVWVEAPTFYYAPKTEEERLDSAVVASIFRFQDSLRVYGYTPNKFERGDWTIERNGQKWGVDQQYIRLGKFSIPTALLALLPLNRMQANPIAAERDRAMAYMRADIQYHAQAAMNEEQFRKAVRAIRDRKERERRVQQQQRPVVSPGERPPE